MLRRLARVLLALATVASIAGVARAGDLTGLYDVQGQYPSGKSYQGLVKIVDYGSAQAILWKLADGGAYEGLAIQDGDMLGSAYGIGKAAFGLVLYRINGGTLDGKWLDSGKVKAGLGRETLQGPPGLNGAYQITLGENRDETTNYSGTVIIKPDGGTYLLAWMVPKLAYIGRGVRVGDVLVVAFSHDPQRIPGVVAYKADAAGRLDGVWAAGNSSRTGLETLTPHAP
jgi:hypothetical protein